MGSVKSGGVPALRLTLGGAPTTWHTVGEYPGLWHPVIAVPVSVVDGDEAWAQARHDDPGCPLGLELVSDEDAEKAAEAYAEAAQQSREEVLARLTARPRPTPDSPEADRLRAEIDNATATVSEEG